MFILALKMPLSEAVLDAVLGYSVVFFGLILLMAVVLLVGKCFTAKSQKQPEPAAPVTPEAPIQQASTPAPGTAGELKLHNVDPKTAAMLMAIVADKLQKPLNELRFISIKEVD